jgi:hypothetical protein
MNLVKLAKKILKAFIPYGIVVLPGILREKYRKLSAKIKPLRIGYLEPVHIKMQLDISDHIQSHIYFDGCYDTDNVLKALELLTDRGGGGGKSILKRK